jgi:mono/diheme cytochrome c family protein
MAALAGCSRPQFANREQFGELESYAQEYVQKTLDSYFGTPEDMIVWEKLPLDAHLASGTVAAGSTARFVKLDLSEPHGSITPNSELLWLDGSLKQSGWVRAWDEEQHQAEIDGSLPAAPAEGTPVIVGPGGVLAKGRMLYAEHCQHCHGVSGDGAGPTARYLNPRPRDYRRGVFKFTRTGSSPRPDRAQKEDLARIIEEGIPGTYMPSFKLLKAEESKAIVEYVLWLSMRGELEYKLIKFLEPDYSREAVKSRVEGGESSKAIRVEFENRVNEGEIAEELAGLVDGMVERWKTSWEPDAVVTPLTEWTPATPESIARGRALYLASAQGCVNCHGEAARGDGPQTYTVNKDFETGQDNAQVGLEDEWGNPIKPRNLHDGIYRGGRRPIDLYCRIYSGIKGSGMPAFGGKLIRPDESGNLTDQDIWDLVNYIYSVPFEQEYAGSGLTDIAASGTSQPAEAEAEKSPAAEE